MPKSLRDLTGDLVGSRALVRVDYNVPLSSGLVTDTMRIDASLPTLKWLLNHGCRPVLLSHLGRPGGAPNPALSLKPVAHALADQIGVEVRFVGACDSPEAVAASQNIPAGGILLLENTRFLPGEMTNDPTLAERLGTLGDFFVNDAFGSMHRAHASTVGVAQVLSPAVFGFLVERELKALSVLDDPPRPFVVAFGGAKISDKIDLLNALLARADRILVGGAMANTFLRAQGHYMGRSLVEDAAVDLAADLLGQAGERIRLPTDVTVTSSIKDPAASVCEVAIDAIPEGFAAVDIGTNTRERYQQDLKECSSLFWNGPMGLFEDLRFTDGTFSLARTAAEITKRGALTVVGGGDSAAAVRQAELSEEMSHVSTGGGAALEYVSTGDLPGLISLDD